MSPKVNRREFVVTSAAGLAAAATTRTSAQAPAVIRKQRQAGCRGVRQRPYLQERRQPRPASRSRSASSREGKDVLDAVIAGVNIVRARSGRHERRLRRPAERRRRRPARRVAACTGRGSAPAASACIEGVRTPSLVAQKVLDRTDHHLIVGKGAQSFARSMGFKIEDDLNTERSRAIVARMEAAHRSGALSRSRQARRRRCAQSTAT